VSYWTSRKDQHPAKWIEPRTTARQKKGFHLILVLSLFESFGFGPPLFQSSSRRRGDVYMDPVKTIPFGH
jgi:hypothetical protein